MRSLITTVFEKKKKKKEGSRGYTTLKKTDELGAYQTEKLRGNNSLLPKNKNGRILNIHYQDYYWKGAIEGLKWEKSLQ